MVIMVEYDLLYLEWTYAKHRGMFGRFFRTQNHGIMIVGAASMANTSPRLQPNMTNYWKTGVLVDQLDP